MRTQYSEPKQLWNASSNFLAPKELHFLRRKTRRRNIPLLFALHELHSIEWFIRYSECSIVPFDLQMPSQTVQTVCFRGTVRATFISSPSIRMDEFSFRKRCVWLVWTVNIRAHLSIHPYLSIGRCSHALRISVAHFQSRRRIAVAACCAVRCAVCVYMFALMNRVRRSCRVRGHSLSFVKIAAACSEYLMNRWNMFSHDECVSGSSRLSFSLTFFLSSILSLIRYQQ